MSACSASSLTGSLFHGDPKGRDVEAFLKLFTQDGELYGAIHGPLLEGGKVEWTSWKPFWKLSRKRLREYWDDPYYIVGKRFNKTTSYVLLDVDSGSQYHPHNTPQAWEQLLITLEDLGLVRPLILCSSNSQGIHLYFPLERPVESLHAAKILVFNLKQAGFKVQNGHLEAFPNVRQRDSQFNGHRLPLQSGSYLLDLLTLEPRTDSLYEFLRAWEFAIAGNDLETFTRAPFRTQKAPKPIKKAQQRVTRIAEQDVEQLSLPTCEEDCQKKAPPPGIHIASQGRNQLPPFTFTETRQTNDIVRQLANWGIERLGLWDEEPLGKWIEETVKQLPGYTEFVSPTSKKDIQTGRWAYRWAKSALRRHKSTAHQYRQTPKRRDWNQYQHDDFETRFQQVFSEFKDEIDAEARHPFQNISAAIAAFGARSLERFDKGFSKQTLYRKKAEIKAALVRPLSQLDPTSSAPTVENNATRVYRLSCKDLEAVHPKTDTSETCLNSNVAQTPSSKAPILHPDQASDDESKRLSTEPLGSVEENPKTLTRKTLEMTRQTNELVQQRIKKDLVSKNGTQSEIAVRHSVSVSTVKRIAKTIKPVTQAATYLSGVISQGVIPRSSARELDYESILVEIINCLYNSLSSAEPKSLEAVAARLIEALKIHREFMTMSQAVDWLLGLPDFDPVEFTRILKERYVRQRDMNK